ncbi:MAG: pyruvate kinase [Armatimonadota bacterium]|nr:pyruvate kinase [Armatimonadota bacterium]MDR7401640.1 pyruvate kinase [Armatimonadota bacterium]MDR7403604.1 pyruvate kinase [Armatimonadota bacterium]MDR7436664.1 pyruvate kinase [Armatimonadota bacterium]MDR7471265.1 pyruvate kinase [Armatimonadota bacterium]
MRFDLTSRDWKRRTTIVATLGPATSDPERIRALIEAGVDVVRLNFSHGDPEQHARLYQLVRDAEAAAGRTVAVMADLAGPKIRVGSLPGGAIDLREGQRLIITADGAAAAEGQITTNYPGLPRDVRRGDRILLDDGTLELEVESTSRTAVVTRVVRGGVLREHKGVNLPGVAVDLPVLTDKDLRDLEVALTLGVDYVALSFVQRARDIEVGRRAVQRLGRQVPLIAKLEKAEAIRALDEILQAADGVMVARGDLGVELDPAWVPVLQKTIIQKANTAGIPVITATQMLESMVSSPRPTRAETSDVANAILDGTDAVMLSAETALGRYPVEAVRMMDRIARAVESSNPGVFTPALPEQRGTVYSVARAAARLAHEVRARAIVAITRSGRTAQILSKLRPHEPLVAFTETVATARRLALWWGVNCFATDFLDNTDAMIAHVEDELIRRRLAAPGDTIVLVGSAPVVVRGRVNFIKVHRVRGRRGRRAG